MKLSPSRYHKKCHNFVDIPSEICECECATEATSRFPFHCRLYTEQRRTLALYVFANLRNHKLTHLLNETELNLYANKALDLAENKSIILAAIE